MAKLPYKDLTLDIGGRFDTTNYDLGSWLNLARFQEQNFSDFPMNMNSNIF